VKTLKETAEGRKAEPHPSVLMGSQQELAIKIEIPNECHCVFDGKELFDLTFENISMGPAENGEEVSSPNKKRKLNEGELPSRTPSESNSKDAARLWILKRSIWRVKIRTHGGTNAAQAISSARRTMILVAVRLEGWSREREFSKEIGWL
jgi:hypothetical protein